MLTSSYNSGNTHSANGKEEKEETFYQPPQLHSSVDDDDDDTSVLLLLLLRENGNKTKRETRFPKIQHKTTSSNIPLSPSSLLLSSSSSSSTFPSFYLLKREIEEEHGLKWQSILLLP